MSPISDRKNDSEGEADFEKVVRKTLATPPKPRRRKTTKKKTAKKKAARKPTAKKKK